MASALLGASTHFRVSGHLGHVLGRAREAEAAGEGASWKRREFIPLHMCFPHSLCSALLTSSQTPPRGREPPAPTLAVAGKETRSRDWHRWGKPPPPPSPDAAPTRGAGSGFASVPGGTGSSRVQTRGGAGRWCSGHRHGAAAPGCGAQANLGAASAHRHQPGATGPGSEGALRHSGSCSSLWGHNQEKKVLNIRAAAAAK